MGLALFKIQDAERVLKLALEWVGADPDVTLAGLEAREASLRRRTLGQTLELFKQHIQFVDDFEIGMSEFLASRNMFVHHFLSLPGFSVDTDEEVAVGIEFLRKLINQADLLTKVMQGLNQMIVNRGSVPDSDEITDAKFNEMLALMMLRPRS
ncbi:hypothetical protein [Bradyrhizobium liaoningense]|uniref:hypothetical protein n=1 Tax=Bradyrhizobium liaoningense TaxID=43992 RepID=UPI001BA85DE3|nr:hypothetical protein [Bradyrhizobium liaoningense]MBR0986534.1 hypothetical protein [Bradyrhizobium liaoningense]